MYNKTTKLLALAKNIQHARKAKKLSQNALAEMLNVSREHLAKIETAKRCVSLSLLFDISDKLDVKEKDLFDFKDI
ncbi:helix-turn-helix transcriptional regulator [bacterium]|nr:helix-turn-helix transcriptional regulator [bacterium]